MYKIVIEHTGCWSQLLSKFPDLTLELLSQNVEVGHLSETLVIFNKEGNSSIVSQFLKELAIHPKIISIEEVYTIKQPQIELIKVHVSEEDSILYIIFSSGILVFKEFLHNGTETWWLAGTNINAKKLKNSVAEIATVREFERFPIDLYINMFSYIYSTLDESQKRLLKFLYENRYFDFNGHKTLQELAGILRISKSNLSRKVRNINKQLAMEYLRKYEIF
ncbi:MAG: hypothetical protein QXP36_11015 [Conexivisphaerales archaeon]